VLTRALSIVIALLAVAAILDAGPTRIRIVGIHQSGTLEPSTISVFVSIPPAPENRGYWTIAECHRDDGLSTRSFRQLEGEQDHPQQPVTFRLSGCVYTVGAVLVGEHGRELARTPPRTVRVFCRNCDDRGGRAVIEDFIVVIGAFGVLVLLLIGFAAGWLGRWITEPASMRSTPGIPPPPAAGEPRR
jgi:hypothetical protein